MRPVNLIPPEERRGDAAQSRTGPLPWVVVGTLVVAVLIVGAMVFTSRDIADKEAEVAALEQQEAEVQARAASLAAFTNFQQIRDARVQTVASLAESRFDWQRVMEELARVIPAHVWLVQLSGDAAGDADASAAAVAPTPTLSMAGCAPSQRAVAKMVSAVGDIDGVTRVSANQSEKADGAVSGASSGSGAEAGDDCRTRRYVTKFELLATFDPVAVPAVDAAPVPAPGAEPAPAGDQGGGGVGDAQQARSEGAEDVAKADRKTENAVKVLPGAGD